MIASILDMIFMISTLSKVVVEVLRRALTKRFSDGRPSRALKLSHRDDSVKYLYFTGLLFNVIIYTTKSLPI